MIDLQTESLVSLSEACSLLPRRRAGKRPHIATLYRWSERGCRGVRLETLQIGGTRCTSREALQRFCETLTHGKPVSRPAEVTRRRQRELERVGRELQAAGI